MLQSPGVTMMPVGTVPVPPEQISPQGLLGAPPTVSPSKFSTSRLGWEAPQGVGVKVAVAVALGDGVAVALGDALKVALTVGLSVSVPNGVGDTVQVWVTLKVGVRLIVGVAVGLPKGAGGVGDRYNGELGSCGLFLPVGRSSQKNLRSAIRAPFNKTAKRSNSVILTFIGTSGCGLTPKLPVVLVS